MTPNDLCTLPARHDDACNGHPRPACCAPMPAPQSSKDGSLVDRDYAEARSAADEAEKVLRLNHVDVAALMRDAYQCGFVDGLRKERSRVETSVEPASEFTEAQRLRDALEMMYEYWENGDACYEDPESCTGYMGRAFSLTMAEEQAVLALIPKFPTKRRSLETKAESPLDPRMIKACEALRELLRLKTRCFPSIEIRKAKRGMSRVGHSLSPQ